MFHITGIQINVILSCSTENRGSYDTQSTPSIQEWATVNTYSNAHVPEQAAINDKSGMSHEAMAGLGSGMFMLVLLLVAGVAFMHHLKKSQGEVHYSIEIES